MPNFIINNLLKPIPFVATRVYILLWSMRLALLFIHVEL